MKKRMKQWVGAVLAGSLLVGGLIGCSGSSDSVNSNTAVSSGQSEGMGQDTEAKKDEYIKQVSERQIVVPDKTDKYRTFYEVFVYSYCDSDGDGIGDLAGLTEKLDYLNDGYL